ncbi:pilus assembly protein [Pseudodesulfovibrio cashew]|uniref:Pilus assembly protein n=1 Tax=Pseudodesulfovibrio cashew TaxID=2678688 RepID=A0A6I6JCR2_9BACT|nr:TadE/TadG family type IV pilus assembly protein [Pseudodesulfovibrio cashew]QGY38840.1 pilus assembly protein [Pseudodesulfovibrio cashew]
MSKRNFTDRRRGVSSVEFALVMPLLFVLTMGLIEFGSLFYSWLTIQKAAQSGARFASTGQGEEEGTRVSQIISVTENGLAVLSGEKEVTVTSWPSTNANGSGSEGSAGGPCQLVEVAVVYAYHPFTPFLSGVFPEVIELTGQDRKLNEPWKPCGD